MSAPRVLLIEALDAAGSDAADAREHCAVLRAAGTRVRGVTLTPAERSGPAEPQAGGISSIAVAAFGAGRGARGAPPCAA
ncbi:MAG: hypothetical protein AAB290_04840 [Candidatus Eisenbacteria bacterium]